MEQFRTLLEEIAGDNSVSSSIWEQSSARIGELAQLLTEHENFNCFDEKVHHLGTTGRSINYMELAHSLLIRARETDANTAIEEVESYLESNRIHLEYAFLISDIRIHSSHQFVNGVRMIDAVDIQDSCVRDSLHWHNQGYKIGDNNIATLLIVEYEVPKCHYPNTEPGRSLAQTPWPPHQLLDDTRLILSLARGGDSGIPLLAAVVIVPKSLSFLNRSISWGCYPEPLVHFSPEIIELEVRAADNRLQQFAALSDETKDRLRIALKRLNDTKIDSDSVNKYINMRVCLENLFLAETEEFQLTKKLKTRIPQHSNLTESEVGNYYSDMSTAVHNGRLPENPSTPIAKIIQLIKNRIVSVLETGSYPTW